MKSAALAALLVALAAAVAGVLYWSAHRTGQLVRGSPTVEFSQHANQAPRPREEIAWPTYGFDERRDRAAGMRLQPPFRRLWTFHGGTLLEFPPAVAYGRVYISTFTGRLAALDARTGRMVWQRIARRCGWSSPTVADRIVYATFIGSDECHAQHHGGEVVALDARTGRLRWRRFLPPTESSPLVARGLVVVGDWNGHVEALSAQTGRTIWRFATHGSVKGSAALAGNRLYIGSYDGHLYALDARTGRELWRASGGPFYATPAVAYGRVFIGSLNGTVDAYGARTGRLLWAYRTGGYVYASPAVWNRLVLIGSYDHGFYAFDAATGVPRWRFNANGAISGAATVVNGIVYFSTFRLRTYGLAAQTGKVVWTWPDGQYSPVVADARRLYLVGHGRMYGMVPLHAAG